MSGSLKIMYGLADGFMSRARFLKVVEEEKCDKISKNFKPYQYTYAKKRKLNERQLCDIKDINDTNYHNERLLSKNSCLKAVRTCTSVS